MMLECPGCGVKLQQRKTKHGMVYGCDRCKGRAVTLPVLRRAGAARAFVADVWQRARGEGVPRVRDCPHCSRRMSEVTTAVAGRSLTLDVCSGCATIWFDARELGSVPRAPAPASKARAAELPKSQRAREQVAMMKLRSLSEREKETGGELGPSQAWQWVPALLGMPVECDGPAVSRRPWVTWGIAGLATAVTAYVVAVGLRSNMSKAQAIIMGWGFVPAAWHRHGGLTLVTSFFLHGGVFHLLSNIYFLMVFGDNVEDELGRWKYVLLLALAHAGGMAAHGLFDPHGEVPCVGASAGISGVIAYYAMAFPRVRLGFMFRIFVIFRWFRIRAIWALGLFVLLQVVGTAYQVNGFSNVSYLAHLGGLVVGVLVAAVIYFVRKHAGELALYGEPGEGYRRGEAGTIIRSGGRYDRG